jgi:hypothetical protein
MLDDARGRSGRGNSTRWIGGCGGIGVAGRLVQVFGAVGGAGAQLRQCWCRNQGDAQTGGGRP